MNDTTAVLIFKCPLHGKSKDKRVLAVSKSEQRLNEKRNEHFNNLNSRFHHPLSLEEIDGKWCIINDDDGEVVAQYEFDFVEVI